MIWKYEYVILKNEFLTNMYAHLKRRARFQVTINASISTKIFWNAETFLGKNNMLSKLKVLPTHSPPRVGPWSRDTIPIQRELLTRPIFPLHRLAQPTVGYIGDPFSVWGPQKHASAHMRVVNDPHEENLMHATSVSWANLSVEEAVVLNAHVGVGSTLSRNLPLVTTSMPGSLPALGSSSPPLLTATLKMKSVA
jgi:hypothetical protein